MGHYVRRNRHKRHSPHVGVTLEAATWQRIVDALQLSDQQSHIVAGILKGWCDKEIAAKLGLKVPTVRTYITRIFERIEVNDRLGVALRVFALAQAEWSGRCRHP